MADPCGFIQGTANRIAEGAVDDAGGVRIHATDNEFLGPLVFLQGPGPGVRTVHASWIGRMTDLVSGGTTNLSMHIHVLFRPDELFGDSASTDRRSRQIRSETIEATTRRR